MAADDTETGSDAADDKQQQQQQQVNVMGDGVGGGRKVFRQ